MRPPATPLQKLKKKIIVTFAFGVRTPDNVGINSATKNNFDSSEHNSGTTGAPPPQAHPLETKNEKTENHDGHNQDNENNGPKKQHTRHPQYTRRYNST